MDDRLKSWDELAEERANEVAEEKAREWFESVKDDVIRILTDGKLPLVISYDYYTQLLASSVRDSNAID